MIRTVILDLGGVYFNDGTRLAIDTIATRYGIDRQAVAGLLNGAAGANYRTGRVTVDQFWQQAVALWHIQASTEELSTIWCESYQPNCGMVRLVERLKAAGHQILYLSDNTMERADYLEKKYGFLKNFDDGIFSHIVKRKKPDPVIYQLLLEKASHPAGACVYIDDKPQNLEPAQKLGMQVIAFNGATRLEIRLKELGLLTEEAGPP
jgi:putative hydrolase of the HAD superfamily